MFKRIHQKLGTAGFVIAIVALVAALGGTALAAAKLNGTQKKEVEKISKKYAGKPGAAGANGAAGPVGPAGPKGGTGAAGANGSNGSNGATGATGVKGATGPTGVTGATGQTGFTKTLPPGQSETGTWAVSFATSETVSTGALTSISFPIPVESLGSEAFVFTVEEVEEEEFEDSGCAGTWRLPESTKPGVLCVFTYQESEIKQTTVGKSSEPTVTVVPVSGFPEGFGPTGVQIGVGTVFAEGGKETVLSLSGSWAVSAPLES